MACFILYFVLQYLFGVCFAQPSVIITGSSTVIITGSSTSVSMADATFYLNSSEPSTWYNNNSVNMTLDKDDGSKIRVVLSRQDVGFVCGFYCTESCNSYLFAIVVVGRGNPALVWSANRDYPVRENASLELTRDGGLVLKDSDGTKVWSTNTSGKSVLGMNITEAGNLVLFDNEGSNVWQSFDHPTDTLLSGQRLYEGQRLIASFGKTNWSRGLYYATISATGFAAYTTISQGKPQIYYELVSNQNQSSRTSARSNYETLQRGAFVANFGTSQVIFLRLTISYPFDSYIEYIRIDSDGHLKINQHNEAGAMTQLVDMVAQALGECQHPRS